jgi:hypothetical protein
MESAYVTPRESSETPRTYKKRLYAAKFDSLRAAAGKRGDACRVQMAECRLGKSMEESARCPGLRVDDSDVV